MLAVDERMTNGEIVRWILFEIANGLIEDGDVEMDAETAGEGIEALIVEGENLTDEARDVLVLRIRDVMTHAKEGFVLEKLTRISQVAEMTAEEMVPVVSQHQCRIHQQCLPLDHPHPPLHQNDDALQQYLDLLPPAAVALQLDLDLQTKGRTAIEEEVVEGGDGVQIESPDEGHARRYLPRGQDPHILESEEDPNPSLQAHRLLRDLANARADAIPLQVPGAVLRRGVLGRTLAAKAEPRPRTPNTKMKLERA